MEVILNLIRMEEEIKVDKHGFISPSSSPTSENITRENARLEKWQDMLVRWDYNIKRRFNFVKKRVRKGIPDCLRGKVWAEFAEIEQLKSNYPENYYSNLTNFESDNVSIRDIMLDIHRTFPNHILFRDDGPGQQALFRVLKAYALHDTELGYCQGMGFLIAMLLIYMSEENAFWTLVAVMNKYELRGFYLPNMPGIYKALYKINSLFSHYIPHLWKHLQSLHFLPSVFAPSWIMTLYISVFKTDISLRILDIFFCEGTKIIYRVFINIFKNAKDELIGTNIDEILEKLKILPEAYTPDEMIKSTFKISLGRKRLKDLEKEYETNPDPEFKNWWIIT
ncbi:unnamed protein product [Blepharisma stoltei]|uniref:Rab-GAP TBC domain-containing protein n=1 Tax=Blepharisma stoltei TaxID=1481888 RepID=A0AAU9IS45_9CILI|nr:unnamed protein product [Blepharisma stoltei]